MSRRYLFLSCDLLLYRKRFPYCQRGRNGQGKREREGAKYRRFSEAKLTNWRIFFHQTIMIWDNLLNKIRILSTFIPVVVYISSYYIWYLSYHKFYTWSHIISTFSILHRNRLYHKTESKVMIISLWICKFRRESFCGTIKPVLGVL